MGHKRENRVRAFAINNGRLDKMGFPEYAKLEKKHLTPQVKLRLNINSIDELCWVCVECSDRNGCKTTCAIFLKKKQTEGKPLVSVTNGSSAPATSAPPTSAPSTAAGSVPLPEVEMDSEETKAKAASVYLSQYFKEHIQPLFTGKGGQVSRALLKERNIHSDTWIVPDPQKSAWIKVNGVSIVDIDAAWDCAGMALKVVDFQLFEPVPKAPRVQGAARVMTPCPVSRCRKKLHRGEHKECEFFKFVVLNEGTTKTVSQIGDESLYDACRRVFKATNPSLCEEE